MQTFHTPLFILRRFTEKRHNWFMRESINRAKFMEEEASELFCSSSTPPKLTLSPFTSLPRRAERPGVATPPIQLAGAIPFKWEEAPGRPVQHATGSASAAADADRHLGLPPRLSASVAIKEERGGTKILSPAAVVDGPPHFFGRRPLSLTFGGKERSPFGKKREGVKKVRWDVSSEKSSTEDTTNSSSFNSSSIGSVCSYSNGEGGSEGEEEEGEVVAGEEGKEEERMVRILRYKRKRALTCVASHAASQLWASIFGRLKQAVVPCKRNPKL